MNIIITGASKGVGYDLSREMLVRGHRVLAVARSESLLNKLKEESTESKGDLITIAGDITTPGLRDLVARKTKNAGGADVLINNAGLLLNKRIQDFTPLDFDHLFNVNVKGAFFLVQALLPAFNPGAHIVNISSMGGYQGSAKFPGLSLYSSAKGALAVLTESLSEELKDHSIKVNCLALGAVQTEMLAKAFPGYKAPVSAVDMGKFIADFALNASSFINGKIIPVSLSTP